MEIKLNLTYQFLTTNGIQLKKKNFSEERRVKIDGSSIISKLLLVEIQFKETQFSPFHVVNRF